ncbi:hypothetical protein HanIR_Chr03g0142071 [Helianthus annuus]|nr:hypothetical protein HanIR_Chr03g0142071 [Helianthus annuus]
MIGWRCLAKVRGTLHCPNPLVCECGVRLNCPKVVFFVLPFWKCSLHFYRSLKIIIRLNLFHKMAPCVSGCGYSDQILQDNTKDNKR